jgi:hypothetical protein
MSMKTGRAILMMWVGLTILLAACAVETHPEVVETPGPTAAPADPGSVVQAFWAAMAAEDVDAAMALVSDDFKCRGSCYFSGPGPLRAYLQGYINSGNVTTISELMVEGDQVTYAWSIVRNGVPTSQGIGQESMLVQDGRIVFWDNRRP